MGNCCPERRARHHPTSQRKIGGPRTPPHSLELDTQTKSKLPLVDALARQVGHAIVQGHERSGVNHTARPLIDGVGVAEAAVGVGKMGRVCKVKNLGAELYMEPLFKSEIAKQ